jgi:hypothetical protein
MNVLSKLSQKTARSPGDPKVLRTGPSSKGLPEHVAQALGWLSIGLGLAELIAPGRMARALGMEGREGLLRGYGARELAAGRLGLSVNKTTGMWSRVAGDVIDLATLAYAYNRKNPKQKNVGAALAIVAGIALVDLATAQTLTERNARGAKGRPRSYGDRSGWPQGLAKARGAAADFMKPDDMRAFPPTPGQPPVTDGTSIPAEHLRTRGSGNESGSMPPH